MHASVANGNLKKVIQISTCTTATNCSQSSLHLKRKKKRSKINNKTFEGKTWMRLSSCNALLRPTETTALRQKLGNG